MKKKIIITLVLCLVVSCLTGCGTKNKPEEPVTAFCESMKEMNFEEMSKTLVSDTTTNFQFEPKTDSEKEIFDFLKTLVKGINFKQTETKTDKDKTTITVEFTYKDCSKVFEAVSAEMKNKAIEKAEAKEEFTEEDANALFGTVLKEVREKVSLDDVSAKCEFTLNKVDNEWKIGSYDSKVISAILTSQKVNEAAEIPTTEEFGITEEATMEK